MIQAAIVYLALGEFELARHQADAMATRLASVKHVGTLAYAYSFLGHVRTHTWRPGSSGHSGFSALPTSNATTELAQWDGFRQVPRRMVALASWQCEQWHFGDEKRRIALASQSITIFHPLTNALLALAKSSGQIDAAFATLDQTLIETNRTGQRWYDAEFIEHTPKSTSRNAR